MTMTRINTKKLAELNMQLQSKQRMSKKELKELIFLDPVKFEEAKRLNSTEVLTPTMNRVKSRTGRRRKRKQTETNI